MPLKPCLSCGTLTPNTRCPECEAGRNRARDAARGGTSQRSYGSTHQQVRAALLPLAYGTACPRCGQTMHPWQALDLDHSNPDAKRAGAPGDRITHRWCNRAGRNWRQPPGRAGRDVNPPPPQ